MNRRWRVSKQEAGTRLLQFLRGKCSDAPSVKAIKRAIDGKCCTVNRRIETFSSYILKENDIVELKPFEAIPKSVEIFTFDKASDPGLQQAEPVSKQPMCKHMGDADSCKDGDDGAVKSEDFNRFRYKKEKTPVLFEDKDLLIINKPSGVVSEGKFLVHRLDKETSGVLVLAKNQSMQEAMEALFKKREVHKIYLAIVDGKVAQDEGVIDNALGKIHSYQGQTIYRAVDAKKGKRAITSWKCLKRGKQASLLQCEPYTGRTHQIRAHLSGMGHPILGDVQYGKRFCCTFHPQRNMLHAYRIQFKHPSTGQKMDIVAPIPSDFKETLDGAFY